MRDSSDMDLVRRYAQHHDDAAFAELVQRHVNLVYSVALRYVASGAQAEEITQVVFVTLARKGGGLRPDTVLAAWLYETARLTAISFLRGERRRQFREQEAYMQSTLDAAPSDPAWQQLAPLLDDAMMWLDREDREAVVLRFFGDKNLREVAASLNINEAAAQKRVYRAVERLRMFFAKRGVVLPAAALTAAISTNAVQAAPVGLAVTISTAAALGGTTLATTVTATATKAIAMTTLQKTIIGATLAVAVGTGIYVAVQPSHPRTEGQGTYLRADIDQDIPLVQAIEQANAKIPDVQPLTEEEVVAAVRAIKLEYKDIPDPIYKIYQRIVKERILPKGMYFDHTSGWRTQYGDFEVDWNDLTLDWERAGVSGGKPGAIFVYRIRARFISLVGDETSATTQAPTRPKELEKPGYLGIRADIDKDIPLAQAIELANAKYGDVQPLTEAEVVAAVRAIKLEHRDIPDPVYEIYQRVVKERVLPKGMYFSHIPGWDTEYGRFEVDWKDLTLDWDRTGIKDGKSGSSFNYRIRARFISAEPPQR